MKEDKENAYVFPENILKTEIENYLQKGFGSYNKNDFEVMIFHLLLKTRFKGWSNYQISRDLRIPETKVKKLRYEEDLKYGAKNAEDEGYKKEKFKELDILLKNAKYKKESKKISFVIEDPSLRKFLDNILKQHHSYSDSSFNSEIVTISPNDLEIILESFPEGQKTLEIIKNKIEDLGGSLGSHASMKEVLPEFFLALAQTAANISGFGNDYVSLSNLMIKGGQKVWNQIKDNWKRKETIMES